MRPRLPVRTFSHRRAGTIFAVAVYLLTSFSLVAQAASPRLGAPTIARVKARAVPARMPSIGPKNALVTIVGVSDFQCPFCSRAVSTLGKLLRTYPKELRIVFANNPLAFHSRAKAAALAALAAHRQGRFWKMHDMLFANQRKLTDENFQLWAIEGGLDIKQFNKDRGDPALLRQVEREQRAAAALGARGTPAFFINGQQLNGAQPFAKFKAVVDSALLTARRLRSSGKRDAALMLASFEAGDPVKGKLVAEYFFGDGPVPDKPPPLGRRSPKKLALKKSNYEVWNIPVDPRKDHIQGDSRKAVVTIVAYSDFECPFCRRGAVSLNKLRALYGDKVRLVFRHYPLPFHRNAMGAHRAAVAAGNQGKFWQLHDKIFDNQRKMKDADLLEMAKEIGLKLKRFNVDRASPKSGSRVARDMASSQSLGLRGTPNFFFNGRKLRGARPLALMKKIVDEELKKAKGKRGHRYYEQLVAKGKVYSTLKSTVHKLDLQGLPSTGPKKAKVTLTIFTDFQCPFCVRALGGVNALAKRFPKRLRVVYAHYPLNFHKQARQAARLAQLAYETGGFSAYEQVARQLYASQRNLTAVELERIAKQAGLKTDVVRPGATGFDAAIDRSMATAKRAGLRGTPTLYINGRQIRPGTSLTLSALERIVKPLF